MSFLIEEKTILQDRYLIKEMLGKGGMGAIYLAEDTRLDCEIAIKQTLLDNEDECLQAFFQEARLLANLNHPALPKVFDFFHDEQGEFLVMELIRGDDLEDLRKKRGGKLSLSEIQDLAKQLFNVVDYLHNQKTPVIHKDIKPANLKLDEHGNIKLLDFGLAKGSAGLMTEYNRSILLGGTPAFAPPEQLDGEVTDIRSDIFSIGATIYCLLTAQYPPNALNKRALSIIRGNGDPLKLISDLNSEVPQELALIINKSMSLSPDERFQNVNELKTSFDNFFENHFSTQNLLKKKAEEYFDLALNCKTNDFDCQILYYSKAIEFNPNLYGAYLNRSVANLNKGNLGNALQDTNFAIKLNPNNLGAYVNRGLILEKLNNLTEALANYNKAIELNPRFSTAFYNRALIFKKLRKFKDAIKDLDMAISIENNNSQYYFERAKLNSRHTFIWQKALEDLNKAISLNPQNSDFFNERADIYKYICKYELAINDCEVALKLNPRSAMAYLLKGLTYWEKGDMTLVLENLGKAIELEPNYKNAYSWRAQFLSKQEKYNEALRDYDFLINLEPTKWNYLKRADIYKKLGNLYMAYQDENTANSL